MVAGLLLVTAGCTDGVVSGGAESSTSSLGTTTPTPEEIQDGSDGGLMEVDIPDEGMSVDEALAAGAGPVVVYGQLYDDGSGLLLCGALTRSRPPGCVGEPISVDGLDLEGMTLETHGAISWSATAIVLEGVIDDATLRDAAAR